MVVCVESAAATGAFPPVIQLSSLDGANGFVLKGIDAGDYSGWSVSEAGDVNGDSLDDLLIGAHFAQPNGQVSAGEKSMPLTSRATRWAGRVM
jgi:hypothetical protein